MAIWKRSRPDLAILTAVLANLTIAVITVGGIITIAKTDPSLISLALSLA